VFRVADAGDERVADEEHPPVRVRGHGALCNRVIPEGAGPVNPVELVLLLF
jgi:hypothetical protein